MSAGRREAIRKYKNFSMKEMDEMYKKAEAIHNEHYQKWFEQFQIMMDLRMAMENREE